MLAEVLVYLYSAIVGFHSVYVLIEVHGGPDQFVARAEARVDELGESVDHELRVAADREVPACGGEPDRLRERLRVAKVLHDWLDLVAFFKPFLLNQLQVRGLDLTLLDPYYFSIGEAGEWSFLSYLDDHCGIVEAESHVVGLRERMDGPDSLQPVVEEGLFFERD